MSARFCFALVSIAFALGCSSTTEQAAPASDTGTADTSTADTTPADTGTPSDTSPADTATSDSPSNLGVKCGETTCPVGEHCCVSGDVDAGFSVTCLASCPAGGGVLKCDGPEDCQTGEFCCAEVAVEGTPPLNCTFRQGTAECRNTCTSNIPLTCPETATVRACQQAADCTEPEYKNCCEFERGGQSATFCVSDTVKAFSGGGCF
jgi:hypothetical protein